MFIGTLSSVMIGLSIRPVVILIFAVAGFLEWEHLPNTIRRVFTTEINGDKADVIYGLFLNLLVGPVVENFVVMLFVVLSTTWIRGVISLICLVPGAYFLHGAGVSGLSAAVAFTIFFLVGMYWLANRGPTFAFYCMFLCHAAGNLFSSLD